MWWIKQSDVFVRLLIKVSKDRMLDWVWLMSETYCVGVWSVWCVLCSSWWPDGMLGRGVTMRMCDRARMWSSMAWATRSAPSLAPSPAAWPLWRGLNRTCSRRRSCPHSARTRSGQHTITTSSMALLVYYCYTRTDITGAREADRHMIISDLNFQLILLSAAVQNVS